MNRIDESPTNLGGAGVGLRRGASIVISLLVALLWGVLLAWLVGRVLTDRFQWSQWLWWIPTPAAIVVAALGLTLALRRARTPRRKRHRWITWGTIVFILVGYLAVVEHRLLRSAARPPPASASLTIAHWNMTLDNYSPIEQLLEGVADLDADVMVITSPPGEVRRRLSERAAASEGRERIYNGWPLFVVTRVPISRVRMLVAADQRNVVAIELDAREQLGRGIVMYTVDMPSYPRIARTRMARDVRRLLDETTAPQPDLVVGDFNIPRGSASIATLFPGMRSAFDLAGHGYGASFPRRFPLYHIDQVLLREGSGLTIARYDIIDEGLSRHRAQKAWIVSQ